jgi:hypothetical protein
MVRAASMAARALSSISAARGNVGIVVRAGRLSVIPAHGNHADELFTRCSRFAGNHKHRKRLQHLARARRFELLLACAC